MQHAIRFALITALLFSLAGPLAAASEEIVETHPLAAGGSISLENINGDVRIEIWDRDEVEIRATKTADADRLEDIRVEIDASEKRIRIETEYSSKKRNWWGGHTSVEYDLRVPRFANLDSIELVNGSLDLSGLEGSVEVSLVNGNLDARDLRGAVVEMATVNGRLEVAFDDLGGNQEVELSTVNGRLHVQLPAGADAEISASTVHGSIANDWGLEVVKHKWVGSSMKGSLGNGSARLSLDTVNGSIRVR